MVLKHKYCCFKIIYENNSTLNELWKFMSHGDIKYSSWFELRSAKSTLIVCIHICIGEASLVCNNLGMKLESWINWRLNLIHISHTHRHTHIYIYMYTYISDNIHIIWLYRLTVIHTHTHTHTYDLIDWLIFFVLWSIYYFIPSIIPYSWVTIIYL